MDLTKEVTTKKRINGNKVRGRLRVDFLKRETTLNCHTTLLLMTSAQNETSYECLLLTAAANGCAGAASAEEVLALNPGGVFLSNSPGDPEPCTYAIEATKVFLEKGLPIFGICLSHQILALAMKRTVKMKFGHHGANHPVKDLDRDVVMITSQNHGFAADEDTLPETLRATHKSLFDGSLQGIHRTDKPTFSFQGHQKQARFQKMRHRYSTTSLN